MTADLTGALEDATIKDPSADKLESTLVGLALFESTRASRLDVSDQEVVVVRFWLRIRILA